MERGSDKHTPRVDEDLKHATRSMQQGAPVESRADESREQEGPGEGEPTPDSLLTGGRDAADEDVLTHDEVEARSELARHIEPSIFPADRDAIIASAIRLQAPQAVVDRFASLPDGTFDHFEAVWEALGGRVEFRG